MPVRRLLLAVLLLLAIATPAHAEDVPPAQSFNVGTALPPGENGRVTAVDEARGRLTGDYGPNTEDQRVLYWDGHYKEGRFQANGQAEVIAPGTRVYRDDFGVPAIYGDTSYDTWFGAGYAAGQDRLFVADGVRHVAKGTYAELVGPSGVPADIQTRVLTYSDADYQAMFAALPVESQNVLKAYVAGLNAYIQHVRVTPAELPAEYALLSTVPEDWTLKDTLASGVLLTRFVAASGGEEFREIAVLRSLQQSLGQSGGFAAFEDLRWQRDQLASVSVPPEEGRFANNDPVPAANRAAVTRASAAYALSLPPELATGPGTGAAPAPASPVAAPAVASSMAGVAAALESFRASLHGGSYMFAVSGKRTSTGAPMLVNGPQLSYTFPTLLYEQEVHGGGYNARGVTVPGVPTIAIGYGTDIAWGMTTGYSKTIDSFIETTRRTAGKLEYLHKGVWKAADCRTEVIRYRPLDPEGAPVGPAVRSVEHEVCRTVHGPIVATSNDGTKARSVDYAMYNRELENINGILLWDKATNLAEFEAGVKLMTWNENVMYAGKDGHIAYWHPGRYPRRSSSWDTRFPAPGTGEHDNQGVLPFAQLPHSIDPGVGYLANWNNKPAQGWADDYLDPSSSRSSGRAVRVQTIQKLLATEPRLTPARLRTLEFQLGTTDQRSWEFLPLIKGVTGRTDQQRAALGLVRAWNGRSYGPDAGTSSTSHDDATVTDGPGPTIFRHWMDDLRDEVLQDLPHDLVVAADAVVSHLYEGTPADNLVLRILRPSESSLTPSRDYLRGRSVETVVLAALDRSIAALTTAYGTDPAAWRDAHPRSTVKSLTGVIGPSRTMPYQDRGSWVQVIDFQARSSAAPVTPPAGPRPPPLAATGLPMTPALIGLVLVLFAVRLRRPSITR